MKSEVRNDLLNIARMLEKQGERCRMQARAVKESAYDDKDVKALATWGTVSYVGATASLLASTLCEIVENEQAQDIFSLDKTNCVLREWGLDELV